MKIKQSEPPGKESPDEHLYLTDLSDRDNRWDRLKFLSGEVSRLYLSTPFDSMARRMGDCSGLLEFGWSLNEQTGELKLKLKSARFCRGRHCPICQWRRALMWVARFLRTIPKIREDYPKARFIFLTLTVQNCELGSLRVTLKEMNRAFTNLKSRKDFPALGWLRSTEVTRGKDDTAHPHFHCLLMVPSSYFKGQQYLSQADWTEMWKSALKVNYTPIVDVRAVKPNKKWLDRQNQGTEPTFDNPEDAALSAAVVETLKYSVKPDDLIGAGGKVDEEWLGELTAQLYKTRAVAIGGALKAYFSEDEPEDLVTEEGDGELLDDSSLWFGWREMVKRYVKVGYR